MDTPVKEAPAKEKSIKEKRRSSFYPVAPEDLAIQIDPPVRPKEKTVNEKRNSRVSGALMAPTMDPSIAFEAFPTRASMDLRARRGSSSTVASFSTAFSSRDSLEGRGRASSWGSQTSLESMASSPLKNAPWIRNQRPSPIKKPYRSKAKPGELFAALPGEVLELILEELKKLHLQPGSDSCATCWMRDCCAIALSARKWSKFARTSLYEDIRLVGEESGHLKKKYKINHGGRMVLLRRTLRSSPQIAVIVRSLKVPRASLLPAGMSTEQYHDLVASVVMACPNLERLVGFYPNYSHTFSRLFHALSTRQRLKEMNWIVEPSPYQRQHKIRPSINGTIAPGDLQPQQSQEFYDHHVNWSHMTSLTVHCRPGATLTPSVLLNDALHCLSTLQTLHLSHLPYTSFNDRNLLCLPSLKKLTLAHLPGITTAGISSFATRKSSTSINTLTLININIDSLPALARIFSNLTSLTTFSLVQPSPPVLPADECVMLFPYLASASLHKLHWDIPYLPTGTSMADTILSRSISAGGFPALRVLRAPNDPEGLFQSVCRPRERVDLPADRYRYGNAGPNAGPGRSSSFGGGGKGGPADTPGFAPPADAINVFPRDNSDLHAARLAAQGRLEAAKRLPRYVINVVDENGTVVEKFGVGAFLGSVESKINYLLLPDAGGTDEGGGLVGIKEMLGDNGEEIGVREGCTGKWNANEAVADKKDRGRWLHTERGRWRAVVLS
ncbi:hypothetical protein CONLIGDRAFT_568268 [Coniochaeta ligniaria NRRL 30616]|uniref:F-box domain-containing protein n=1 Tax=Coniochaeta ligniaria NRRL 30616 TaxID=1408157 RepID=A0A1J7K5Z0_9PEZI|nr:hypothetical protein CONLIGDRAFT_568268 [Coniochaeta ligniaria NRRL 30616]